MQSSQLLEDKPKSYQKLDVYKKQSDSDRDLLDNHIYPAEYFAHHLVYQRPIQNLKDATVIETLFGKYTAYSLKDDVAHAGLVPVILVKENEDAKDSDPQEVRVLFRGTQCAGSLWRDLEAKGAGGKTLKNNANVILQKLNDIIKDRELNNISLKISGHSLGGADALGFSGYVLKNLKSDLYQFKKIKAVDTTVFNAARPSKESAETINKAADAVKNDCAISATFLIAEGDIVQRTGEAYPYLVQDEKITTCFIKVKHPDVDPYGKSDSYFAAAYIPSNTKIAHTTKYFYTDKNNTFDTLNILHNHDVEQWEAMCATGNVNGSDSRLSKASHKILEMLDALAGIASKASEAETPAYFEVDDYMYIYTTHSASAHASSMLSSQCSDSSTDDVLNPADKPLDDGVGSRRAIIEEKAESSNSSSVIPEPEDVIKAKEAAVQSSTSLIVFNANAPSETKETPIHFDGYHPELTTSPPIAFGKPSSGSDETLNCLKIIPSSLSEKAKSILDALPEIPDIIVEPALASSPVKITGSPTALNLNEVDNKHTLSSARTETPKNSKVIDIEPQITKNNWFNKLSTRQKIAFCVVLSLLAITTAIVTGGLIYAPLAGLAVVSVFASIANFSSMSAAGSIIAVTSPATVSAGSYVIYKLMEKFPPNHKPAPPYHGKSMFREKDLVRDTGLRNNSSTYNQSRDC